jgi:hypothetical protein
VSNPSRPRGSFLLEEVDSFDDGEKFNLAIFGNNMLAGPLRGASVTAVFGEGCFKLFFERPSPTLLPHEKPNHDPTDSNPNQGGKGADATKDSFKHNECTVTEALGLDPDQSSAGAHETSNPAAGLEEDMGSEQSATQIGHARGQKRPFSEVEE